MKLERNAPCPCGSGKKYKKCCYTDPKKNAELIRAVSRAHTPEALREILTKSPEVYRLKVTLLSMSGMDMDEEVSRTFEVEDKDSLYRFHLRIQDAFRWDNDHMFSFYFGQSLDGADPQEEYSGDPLGGHYPRSWGPPSHPAIDAELRDLALYTGATFWYRFDYGDDLMHEVVVENIRDQIEGEELPRIVAEVGTPPPQYGEWDDEEE